MKAVLVALTLLVSVTSFAGGREFSNEEMVTAVLTSSQLLQAKVAANIAVGMDKVGVVRKKNSATIYLSYDDGRSIPCGVKAEVEAQKVRTVAGGIEEAMVVTAAQGVCAVARK